MLLSPQVLMGQTFQAHFRKYPHDMKSCAWKSRRKAHARSNGVIGLINGAWKTRNR